MNLQKLNEIAYEFVEDVSLNAISEEIALSPEVVGAKMFDMPIFGFSDAFNPLFERLKDPSVIGEHHMLPLEWFSGAVSVVSFFIPFTKDVVRSNAPKEKMPSLKWLHARIDGQKSLNVLLRRLAKELNGVAPAVDERFQGNRDKFTSNWSERHVAYCCGLGTFGLSKSMITEKGSAGRFGSVITPVYFEPLPIVSGDIYANCNMCGVCIKNCPVNAISFEHGKDHALCRQFNDHVEEVYSGYHGCGKCQAHTQCSFMIPREKK